MTIQKKYLKTRPVCKVTFTVSASLAGEAARVALAGDFNGWDTQKHIMKSLKKGGFQIVLDLNPGQSYQFRYVIDDTVWINDPEADGIVSSGMPNADNSVIEL